MFVRTVHGTLLLIVATVVGATPTHLADAEPVAGIHRSISELVNRYAEEHLPRGEILVGVDVGGTGGFSTFVAAVPERGLSIAVFGTSAVSVDPVGRAIVLGWDRAEAPATTTPLQWAIFVVSVWARSAPSTLYVPGLEIVLAMAAAGVGIVQVARALPTGESVRITGGRSAGRSLTAGVQIVIFGWLAIVLW